jgi:hypothetical protein
MNDAGHPSFKLSTRSPQWGGTRHLPRTTAPGSHKVKRANWFTSYFMHTGRMYAEKSADSRRALWSGGNLICCTEDYG